MTEESILQKHLDEIMASVTSDGSLSNAAKTVALLLPSITQQLNANKMAVIKFSMSDVYEIAGCCPTEFDEDNVSVFAEMLERELPGYAVVFHDNAKTEQSSVNYVDTVDAARVEPDGGEVDQYTYDNQEMLIVPLAGTVQL